MFQKAKAFIKKNAKNPLVYGIIAAVFAGLFVFNMVRTSAPSPEVATQTPAEKVVSAVTSKDPSTIEGIAFVPLSQLEAIVASPSVKATNAAINPTTSVIAVAEGSKVLVANYLPQTVTTLMDALSADGAVVSVNPSASRTTATPATGYPRAIGGYSPVTGTTGAATDATKQVPGADLYAPTLPTAAASSSSGFSFMPIIFIMLTLAVGFLVFRFMMVRNRQSQIAAAKAEAAEIPTTRFENVAGCEEAIEDMEELVDFLRNPTRYADLGAKVPHGACLVGPPGTGKTLLARALAGETGATFIPVSGSDFVEMYVGVGAKRVRELFRNARKQAESGPVIVFIDEIDAVGRKRSSGPSSNGNTEQEGTLNALLVELDGFSPRDNIIIIGATNRADMLDDALLRPGRLERQIMVPLPNRVGREAILRVHLENKPVGSDVDLEVVARRTMGFSGAELAALANEAALICVREGRFSITEKDLSHATETVAMGKVRKSAIVSETDRLITAWHEAGHAVCGIVQPEGTDVVSISLLPRGQSGGQTWFADGDMAYLTRKAAYARLVTGMGGMAAEQMFFGDDEYTTGPSGDLQQCTNTALAMIAQYGMGDELLVKDGNVLASGSGVTDKVFAEAEALLKQALLDAKQLLADNREFFDRMVTALLDRDTLTASEIEELKAGHDLVAPPVPPAPLRKPVPVAGTPSGGQVVLDPFGGSSRPKQKRGRIGRLIGAVAEAWSEPERRPVR